jgi:hypothetical protein
MARCRRTSSQTDKEEFNRRGELEPPCGPTGHNQYVIYIDKRQEQGSPSERCLVSIFNADYAAAWVIRTTIGNDEWDWVEDPPYRDQCIRTSAGIEISMYGENLKKLMDFEPSEKEKEWKDERLYPGIMRLKYGTVWEAPPREKFEEIEVEDEVTGEVKKVKQKKVKEKKPPKEKKAKVDKSGMVTAGDLAKDLGIEPRIFRGALRAMKKIKPQGGWFWTSDEAKGIKAEVEKHLKSEGKKNKGKKKK